jgi:hypothetical protein
VKVNRLNSESFRFEYDQMDFHPLNDYSDYHLRPLQASESAANSNFEKAPRDESLHAITCPE